MERKDSEEGIAKEEDEDEGKVEWVGEMERERKRGKREG